MEWSVQPHSVWQYINSWGCRADSRCNVTFREESSTRLTFRLSHLAISAFSTFPMPEASISRLGRKVLSPDWQRSFKSEFLPMVSALPHLWVSGYLKAGCLYQCITKSIPSFFPRQFSLPPSCLSHHTFLQREILPHIVMKRTIITSNCCSAPETCCASKLFLQFTFSNQFLNMLNETQKSKHCSILAQKLLGWTQHKSMGLSKMILSN